MKLWHHVFLQLRTYVLIEAFHLLFPSKIPNDKEWKVYIYEEDFVEKSRRRWF